MRNAARFLLVCPRSRERFDQCDWQADNGVGGAVDQVKGKQAILQAATSCFAAPGPSGEVGVDGMLGDLVHENAALRAAVPNRPARRRRGARQPEAHPGENAMGSSGDGGDHPAGVCCVGRLSQWFVVEVAQCVTSQNGSVSRRCH